MIDHCPTCHRRSIACPSCGKLAVDDSVGDLPLWCPSCGTSLRKTLADPDGDAREDLGHFFMQVRAASASVQPRHAILIVIAVTCGLLASVYTHGMLGPPREPVPGMRIVREGYSVQPPDQDWRFNESRWRTDRCDLALEATNRGSRGAQFLVHVVRKPQLGLVLDDLIEQTKQHWSESLRNWTIVKGEGGPTIVAGQPAIRIVALSAPHPMAQPGNGLRREAVVLVHNGIGYRLTAEYEDLRFSQQRSRFNKFIASFALLPADEENPSPH